MTDRCAGSVCRRTFQQDIIFDIPCEIRMELREAPAVRPQSETAMTAAEIQVLVCRTEVHVGGKSGVHKRVSDD